MHGVNGPSNWNTWRHPHCAAGWAACPLSIHTMSHTGPWGTASALAMHNTEPLLVQTLTEKSPDAPPSTHLQVLAALDPMEADDDQLPVLNSVQLPGPVRAMCWRDEQLLIGGERCVYLYRTEAGNGDTVTCKFAHSYNIKRSKEKEVLPNDWLPTPYIKCVGLNPFKPSAFLALENNRCAERMFICHVGLEVELVFYMCIFPRQPIFW